MALRSLLYFVMALGLAGFLGVAWMAMHPQIPAPTEVATAPMPAPGVTALVAARPLRAGALLVPDDVASRLSATPGPDIVIDTPAAREAVLGGMIRHNLPAGAPLRPDNVLRSTDRGFLAAVLAPGMLAVSIGVDPVSGAAGLIWPGDHVDVVLTQSADNTNTLAAAHKVSGETMMADARVIAIDQQLMQGAVGSEAAERNVRTVTLEVTSAQAERIAVGARLGKLSLAVHAAPGGNPAEASDEPARFSRTPTVTWAGDVSSALTGSTANSGGSLRVYSGPEKLEEVHF